MDTVILRLDSEASPAATFEAGTSLITADRMAGRTGTVTTDIPVPGSAITVPGSAFRLDQAIEDSATGTAIAAITGVSEVITDTAAAMVVTNRQLR